MVGRLNLGSRVVDANSRTFIVAELGINHDGSFNKALDLVDAAADAGAEAVKIQWFKASSMYHKKAGVYVTASGEAVDIFDLMTNVEIPLSWIKDLLGHASGRGLLMFPTVCDLESLEEAEQFRFPAYKVASYEISHIPLLRALGQTGKPVILSTGGARLGDIEEALDALEMGGAKEVAVLHCIARYPAPLEEVNLGAITTLKAAFPGTVIGFSDHTQDATRAPVEAVKLGARIIEKHLTLDRSLPGADHVFALEPGDFSRMVNAVREIEVAISSGASLTHDTALIGSTGKTTLSLEADLRRFAYRTIVARCDILPGEVLTKDNIAILRSGRNAPGLHPRYFQYLVEGGFRAVRYIESGRGVQWSDLLTT